MIVYVLSTAGEDSKVLGVFDKATGAIRFADHFKYEEYIVEPFTVETLKKWK